MISERTMCEKPKPPDNQSITEGEEMSNVSFSELYDAIETNLSNGGDKPVPPDNQPTTRDGGSESERPSPPPNQEITKDD